MNRTVKIVLVMLVFSASPSVADEYPRINIIDFVVDWKMYIGKYVIVTGGTMNFVDQTSGTLFAPGASVVVMGPYQNKEHLRYLLKNCSGVGAPGLCGMEVFGEVSAKTVATFPTLKNPQIPEMPQ